MGQAFSKDGDATVFFEALPVVGYVAAAVHGIARNDEHAKRAAAKCTNSSLVTIGTVGGGLVGGIPGAMAGGAAMAGVGIGSQYGVSEHIKDENIRAEVNDVSVGKVATNMLFGGAGGAMGGIGSLAAGTVAKEAGKSATAQFVARTSASVAASTPFVTVPKVLVDQDHQKIHMAKHRARHEE